MSTARNYNGAMSWSARQFLKHLKPRLEQFLEGSQIFHTEADPNAGLARAFDTVASIDAWIVQPNLGMCGLASRIQQVDINQHKPYNTWTIRLERESGVRTEYDKLCYARKHGFLYPYWSAQAYIHKYDDDRLLSFAVGKTTAILDAIARGDSWVKTTGSDQYGQAAFHCVNWIKVWPRHEWLESTMQPVLL